MALKNRSASSHESSDDWQVEKSHSSDTFKRKTRWGTLSVALRQNPLQPFYVTFTFISGFRKKLEKSFHFLESASKNTDFWESSYCHDLTKKNKKHRCLLQSVTTVRRGETKACVPVEKKTFFSAECRVSCAFSEVCFGCVMLQSCPCRVQGESSRKWVIVDAAISQSAWQKDLQRRRNYIALHTWRTVAPGLSVPCVPRMFRNPHEIFKCLRTWCVHPVSHSNYGRRKKLAQE